MTVKTDLPSLKEGLDYLRQLIKARLQTHFTDPGLDIPWQELPVEQRPLPPFFKTQWFRELTPEAYFILLIALAPHVEPQFFDETIRSALPEAGDFPQLGGVRGKHFRGFLPTGETAVFLLAGGDLQRRFRIQQLLSQDHLFYQRRILWVEEPPAGEPFLSGKLRLSQEYVELLTTGNAYQPRFGINFPARRLETQLGWEDLVLNDHTLLHIEELLTWVEHSPVLLHEWGMSKRLKPGYRALFYGPPGTGKTMTASLLGKHTQKEVYKIDLSLVVSKYIGETEKNLSNLFDVAEHKDWILFFDEADALFGKRTSVRDAHDKYANQEISYLLQRVETYNGLVILASNLRSNIDEAFVRRFQSIIYFPMPSTEERLRIWEKAFPANVQLSDKVNLESLAQRYKLTGANITNIVQHACLQTLAINTREINLETLTSSIKREFDKEGKLI